MPHARATPAQSVPFTRRHGLHARMTEQVDETDSKSVGSNPVQVRILVRARRTCGLAVVNDELLVRENRCGIKLPGSRPGLPHEDTVRTPRTSSDPTVPYPQAGPTRIGSPAVAGHLLPHTSLSACSPHTG